MHLKIILPSRVFTERDDVCSVVADTCAGSVGLLPHRLDCVAALVPGILTYSSGSGDVYLAVDEGVLVKTGELVLVSVRHAIGGSELAELHDAVKRQFLVVDEHETQVRTALAEMENRILAKFADFHDAR